MYYSYNTIPNLATYTVRSAILPYISVVFQHTPCIDSCLNVLIQRLGSIR